MKHYLLGLTLLLSMAVTSLAQIALPPSPPTDPDIPTTERQQLPNVERASLNLSEGRVLRLVNRIGRTYRFMNLADLTTAGPSIEDLSLLGDFSYAFIDDDAIGDDSGREYSASLYLTATIAGDFQGGIGISENYYHVQGPGADIEQSMYTLDAFLTYSFTEEFSAGGFVQYSDVDIEDALVSDPSSPTGFTNIGDQFDRYAVGLLASYRRDFGVVVGGITTSVSSYNKENPDDFFDNEDSAWITVADVERQLTDDISVDVFVSYFTLLDNEAVDGFKQDGSYWSVGFDVAYQLSADWFFSAGYETQLSYRDYSEHRINAAVSYTW